LSCNTAVCQWIGAIALDLGCDGLPPMAHQLLALLSHELARSDESDSGKQLCQLAKQVSDLIKRNWEWRYICSTFPVCKSVWPQDGLIIGNVQAQQVSM